LKDIFDASKYSYMMNYLGLPAAVISTGLHDELPIGVQIVGRRYREDLCLDAIETIEKQVGVMIHNLWNRDG
jgi:amidase